MLFVVFRLFNAFGVVGCLQMLFVLLWILVLVYFALLVVACCYWFVLIA